MDLISKILADVPKDVDGFDDLDAFWKVTDKLAFPLSERILSSALRSIKVSRAPGTPLRSEEEETEMETDFDYDTSSEISFELTLEESIVEEKPEEEDDDDASTEPENETNLPRNMNKEATPAKAPPSPVPVPAPPASASVSAPSTVKKRLSSATLSSSPDTSLLQEEFSFTSRGTARGRKSSLLSEGDASTLPPLSSTKSNPPTPSIVRNASLNTTHNTSQSSLPSSSSPAAPTPSISHRKEEEEEREGEGELSLSHPSRLTMSSRRVSFGQQINLSPIGNEDWTDQGDDMQLQDEESLPPSLFPPLSSASKTPLSTPKKTASYPTPKSMISTPGSNDFRRGRRLSDSTFIEEEGREEEEREEKDSMSSGEEEEREQEKKGKGVGKKGGKKGRDIAETEGETDLSTSFVDNSYLFTISSANKRYAGKKLLAERKQTKKEQQQQAKQSKRKRSELYTSEEEQEEEEEEESDEEGVRRSRRATKGRRFAFWKGERPIYQEGTMVGLVTTEPTPKKSRPLVKKTRENNANQQTKRRAKAGSKSSSRQVPEEEEEEEGEYNYSEIDRFVQQHAPPPPVQLPLKVNFLDAVKQPSLLVWDEYAEHPVKQKVVSVRAAIPPMRPLPAIEDRPAGKDKTGAAAHTFVVNEVEREMSGWIAGYLDLPPQAIKDAEFVGKYAQVFFIAKGQEKALEFAIADPTDEEWSDKKAQRLLLSPGDSFFVPAGNTYRLENHSSAMTCEMFFVVVQPISEPDHVVGSSVSNNTVATSR